MAQKTRKKFGNVKKMLYFCTVKDKGQHSTKVNPKHLTEYIKKYELTK